MKNKNLTWIILGVILVLIVALVAFNVQKEKEEVIRVGILTPLTGPVSEYGENTKKGIELAVYEINERGGIQGKKIQLFVEDSKCDPKESITGFNKLVGINLVEIVLGTVCSSETLAIAPLANEKNILVVSSAASSPEITNAGDYIFRVYPSDDYEADIAAKTIFNKFEKTRVSLLYLNNDYGVALKKTFKEKFTELGGTVLNEESYLQETKDFRSQLIKIKANNPEVIYAISYPVDGGIAIKQAKELGINTIFFGTSGLKANDFISNGGSAVEGFILAASSQYSSVKRDEFIKNYEERFGIKPGLTSDIAYDSVYLIKESFKNAKDIQDVKNNLYQIKGFEGASGNITFDENGDLTNINYELLIIRDGQFVLYEE